jgi:2',3'-cyclic-nucleotide 2'-phosphodiesterase (5'-nucleotidase family)
LDWAEDRQCSAGNLFADALLDLFPDAQVALALGGHWRGGLAAGPVTLGSLIEVLRSTASPAQTTLTGAQILQFVREGLKSENAARKLRPLRGIPVGLPHLAGMTVRVDSQVEDGMAAEIRGEPLQRDREYVVAATDLEFFDLVGYLHIPEDQIKYEVPIIMPEVVEAYIARHSPLGGQTEPRIQISDHTFIQGDC